MLRLPGKKIIAILSSIILLNWTYVTQILDITPGGHALAPTFYHGILQGIYTGKCP